MVDKKQPRKGRAIVNMLPPKAYRDGSVPLIRGDLRVPAAGAELEVTRGEYADMIRTGWELQKGEKAPEFPPILEAKKADKKPAKKAKES